MALTSILLETIMVCREFNAVGTGENICSASVSIQRANGRKPRSKHGAVRRRGEGVRRRVDHQAENKEGTRRLKPFPPRLLNRTDNSTLVRKRIKSFLCFCWHAGSHRVPGEMEGLVPQVSPAFSEPLGRASSGRQRRLGHG